MVPYTGAAMASKPLPINDGIASNTPARGTLAGRANSGAASSSKPIAARSRSMERLSGSRSSVRGTTSRAAATAAAAGRSITAAREDTGAAGVAGVPASGNATGVVLTRLGAMVYVSAACAFRSFRRLQGLDTTCGHGWDLPMEPQAAGGRLDSCAGRRRVGSRVLDSSRTGGRLLGGIPALLAS